MFGMVLIGLVMIGLVIVFSMKPTPAREHTIVTLDQYDELHG